MGDTTLKFTGTHNEIGRQVGEQYKKWGKREVRIPDNANAYYLQQLKTYQKYFPLYIEYLEGIAESLNIPKNKVFVSYLTGFLPFANSKPANKCSTFAVNTHNGVFIGRNYDWLESSEKISSLLAYEFTDNSANNFTGITDMGTWERGKAITPDRFFIMTEDAWNDHGLYISLNGAPVVESAIGMCSTHIVQCVAETCKTTEEAVELLSQVPIDQSKMFTIADKSGNFAVVEKSVSKGVHVIYSNDFVITTNHYNHPALTDDNLQLLDAVPFHSTFGRYHYLKYNIEKEKNNLNLDKIKNILGKPPVLQNWRGLDQGDTITVWTYALNLTTGEYETKFAPVGREI